MAYTKHTWVEFTGTGEEKTAWLNNMETQYDEVVSYYTTTLHDDSYYTKEESDAKFFGPAKQGHGSGFVCEKFDGQTAAEILGSQVPPGTIAIWGGSGDVPVGWQKYIFLNDRYPVAAGNMFVVGQVGGEASVPSTSVEVSFRTGEHALTLSEMPYHNHTGAVDYPDNTQAGIRGGVSPILGPDVATTVSTGTTGSGKPHWHYATLGAGSNISLNNMPASRTFYYIIKE